MKMSFITVQIISNPPSQPKSVCLNPTDNLSNIRQQLEKDNIINDALSFSKKYPIGDESYGFAEIALENEKSIPLNGIIEITDEANILYLTAYRWMEEFHLLQCLVVNNHYKIEMSRKKAFNFVKMPTVKSINKSYLEIIRPRTNIEEFFVLNNIFSIKNISLFPFVNKIVDSDDSSYRDDNFLVKFERYEILMDEGHVKPSIEFEQAIKNALKNIKPFKALQGVFDEYGHLFSQKIILGRLFKKNIPNTSLHTTDTNAGTVDKIDLKSATFESLKPHLDRLNISYLLRKGNLIETNELSGLMQDLNNNLEIVEFDNIISLHKILEVEQQRKIENILNNSRIIMTGITDLKDLDNDNAEHYKRINLEPSLEGESYEVFGSIISKDNLKSKDFFVTFGLYDFNGFSAMIYKLAEASVDDIRECSILWMIIGNPSSLSVFSSRNRELQVNYIKESITIQHENSCYPIKISCQLSQEDTISVNAYCSTANHVPINIKLVEWSKNCINFLPNLNSADSEKAAVIDVHLCILPSNSKSLKIDNIEEERLLNLIGDTLTKDNEIKSVDYNMEEAENIEDTLTKNKGMGSLYFRAQIEFEPAIIEDIRVVVSLDFGTTFSGFAYANVKLNKGDLKIVVNNNWPGIKGPMKINTVLQYDENYEAVVAWGAKALTSELSRKDRKNRNTKRPLELFKFYLGNVPESKKPKLPNEVTPNRLITDYLREMGKTIKQEIRRHWPKIDFYRNVRIVVTVPAEFTEDKKTVMRQCIYNAGLIKSLGTLNLQFTTEPEAAAIHCMNVLKEHKLATGASYLVVNCGGGAVDLTVRKILFDDQIGEMTERSGGFCGSTYIDDNFLEFLESRVGKSAMNLLKEKNYGQVNYMVQQFCHLVKMPFTGKISDFETFEWDIERVCPALKKYVTGSIRDQLSDQDDWIVELDFEIVKSFFDPVIDKILGLIEQQLRKCPNCSVIFLVGGFSESRYLHSRIGETFGSRIKIVVPPHPVDAILRGACEYGLNMNIVKTRVLKWTYGVRIYPEWKSGDPISRKTREGCICKFFLMARKGTEVDVNKKFSQLLYPIYPSQTSMNLTFFYTPEYDAEYCDDHWMNLLGSFNIDLPDIYLGKNRPLLVTLCFGAMEIVAIAKNETNGKIYRTTFSNTE